RAVATQGADFENRPSLLDLCDEEEQLPLRRGDLNRWKTGGRARVERGLERRVARQEQIRDVPVDRGPSVERHGSLMKWLPWCCSCAGPTRRVGGGDRA